MNKKSTFCPADPGEQNFLPPFLSFLALCGRIIGIVLTGGIFMEHHKRHVRIWNILMPIAMLLVKLLFNCKNKKYGGKGPYLVLSNHVTDLDPIIVGTSFPQQMYFVTSEHLMRQGFISKVKRMIVSV